MNKRISILEWIRASLSHCISLPSYNNMLYSIQLRLKKNKCCFFFIIQFEITQVLNCAQCVWLDFHSLTFRMAIVKPSLLSIKTPNQITLTENNLPLSLSLSVSPLQVGCSSETQIRSTLPFAWPYFCTTRAPMRQRRPLTWCPTWTTLRQPTASPSPTHVSPSQSRFKNINSCVHSSCIISLGKNWKKCDWGMFCQKLGGLLGAERLLETC